MNIYSIYNYVTCQRPDGSTYGTAGTCRKGVQIERLETGLFSVKDQSGNRVGSIMAEDSLVGGGGIREAGRQSNYTVVVGERKREGLTLARAKAQAKEWLGESSKGDAKVAIKGGLTQKGKERRLKNISTEINEVREKFNTQVSKWNSIPKDQRKDNSSLRKRIEFLRKQYEDLLAERTDIQNVPVVD